MIRGFYIFLFLLVGFASCTETEIQIIENSHWLKESDEVIFIESGLDFEDNNIGLVDSKNLTFNLKPSLHKKSLSKKETLTIIRLLHENYLYFSETDQCGTTYESGYFLFFNSKELIKVIGITCQGQGLIFYPKEDALGDTFRDEVQEQFNTFYSKL